MTNISLQPARGVIEKIKSGTVSTSLAPAQANLQSIVQCLENLEKALTDKVSNDRFQSLQQHFQSIADHINQFFTAENLKQKQQGKIWLQRVKDFMQSLRDINDHEDFKPFYKPSKKKLLGIAGCAAFWTFFVGLLVWALAAKAVAIGLVMSASAVGMSVAAMYGLSFCLFASFGIPGILVGGLALIIIASITFHAAYHKRHYQNEALLQIDEAQQALSRALEQTNLQELAEVYCPEASIDAGITVPPHLQRVAQPSAQTKQTNEEDKSTAVDGVASAAPVASAGSSAQPSTPPVGQPQQQPASQQQWTSWWAVTRPAAPLNLPHPFPHLCDPTAEHPYNCA